MRKLSLLLMIGTILAPWSAEAACKTAPDCASLGFTTDASKCSGTALKCPWDATKAACKEKPLTSELPILYGDGTISNDVIIGNTPIGLVIDASNKLAVAFTNIDDKGLISTQKTGWISGINEPHSFPFCFYRVLEECDYTSQSPSTCAPDGQQNTKLMLETTETITSYRGNTFQCKTLAKAALACNSYLPPICNQDFCKKTKWFLPSINELTKIYNSKTAIKSSLDTINLVFTGRIPVASLAGSYCSSNKESLYSRWDFDTDGGIPSKVNIIDSCYIRPVMKY